MRRKRSKSKDLRGGRCQRRGQDGKEGGTEQGEDGQMAGAGAAGVPQEEVRIEFMTLLRPGGQWAALTAALQHRGKGGL